MGILDGGRSHSYHGSTRGYSPARSGHSTRSHASASASGGGYWTRPTHTRSSSSFFGGAMGGGGSSSSRSPWFGSSKSSYYSRRPRDGYVQYLMQKLQRMIRDLWHYARRHPMKAFFAVVVPLISAGGAIKGLMSAMGIRALGGSRGYGGSSFGGSRGRGGADDWSGTLGSLMSVAKAFA